MLRIVFICTGNLCRSPIAEGILRTELLRQGRADMVVSSMGVHGLENQPPAQFAAQVCQRHGVDITNHRSRQLVPSELNEAGLILSMEPIQKDFIGLFFPQLKDKSFLLGAWPQEETRKSIIKDPYGSPSIKVYEKTFETIQFHIQRIVPYLQSM